MRLSLPLALLALACAPAPMNPEQGPTDFRVDDARLEVPLRDAAEDWARAGLELAALVTINVEPDGLPVAFVGELPPVCVAQLAPGGRAHACVTYGRSRVWGMWLRDTLADDPETLARVLRHEIIHVLLPRVPHLEDDEEGILHRYANARHITVADLRAVETYAPIDW